MIPSEEVSMSSKPAKCLHPCMHRETSDNVSTHQCEHTPVCFLTLLLRGSGSNISIVLVIFFITVTKYLDKGNLSKGGFNLSHILMVYSILTVQWW